MDEREPQSIDPWRMDERVSLTSAIETMATWCEHLLSVHSCDAEGYEHLRPSIDAARDGAARWAAVRASVSTPNECVHIGKTYTAKVAGVEKRFCAHCGGESIEAAVRAAAAPVTDDGGAMATLLADSGVEELRIIAGAIWHERNGWRNRALTAEAGRTDSVLPRLDELEAFVRFAADLGDDVTVLEHHSTAEGGHCETCRERARALFAKAASPDVGAVGEEAQS